MPNLAILRKPFLRKRIIKFGHFCQCSQIDEKIFSWISLLDPTLRMLMEEREGGGGGDAQNCSFAEPDHILQVRWP